MNAKVISMNPYILHAPVPVAVNKADINTRIDDEFQPSTVVDVMVNDFGIKFARDLWLFFISRPGDFITMNQGEVVDQAWVNELRIVAVEALYFQPVDHFPVELVAHTRIRAVLRSNRGTRKVSYHGDVRLQYILNLRPCCRSCRYMGVIVDPAESLLQRFPTEIHADRYLLPVLRDEDYKTIARHIRERYQLDGDKLDARALVKCLGLELSAGRFTDNSVQAELYFKRGRAYVVDPYEEASLVRRLDPEYRAIPGYDVDPTRLRVAERSIRGGTIVLNIDVYSDRSTYDIALLHECTHLICGHKYFLLQQIHGSKLCSYLCKRKGDTAQHERLSPLDIMEIHANKLPGYIMIDDENGKVVAESLLETYKNRGIDGMSFLVRGMAEHFGTTQTMARTRLDAMGYIGVRGIMQYANGKLVPAYNSDLKHGLTYTISHVDAMKEYVVNKEFQAALDSGRYLYCEGHFCLNDRRYIIVDQLGYLHLNRYARGHMSECCLIFEEVYVPTLRRLSNGVLQKGPGRSRVIKYTNPDGSSPVTQEGVELNKVIDLEYPPIDKYPASFNGMLVALMNERHITVEELADRTGLSEETITQMRTRPAKSFSLRSIIAVCKGLNLSRYVSDLWMSYSPTRLILDTPEKRYYRYVLDYMRDMSVSAINRKIVEAGHTPLTNKVDGYDENGVRISSM